MDGTVMIIFVVGVLAIVWYFTGGKEKIDQWEDDNG